MRDIWGWSIDIVNKKLEKKQDYNKNKPHKIAQKCRQTNIPQKE